MRAKVLFPLFIFLAFLVFLSLAYWPVLSTRYLYHDDVIYFMRTPTRIEPPGTLFNVVIGRFLAGHLLILLGFLVRWVEDLFIVRLLSIIQLSLCGTFLSVWLQRRFLTKAQSFWLVLALWTLPASQVVVFMAGMAFQPVAILLAISAGIVCDGIRWDVKPWRRIVNVRMGLVILLFLGALCTYQPGAMFFWVIPATVILFSARESFSRLCARVSLFFFAAGVTLFFYSGILFLTKKMALQYQLYDYNPYRWTADWLGKLQWFVSDVFLAVSNLWNIFPLPRYSVGLGLCVAGALGIACLGPRREHRIVFWSQRAAILVTMGVLLLLSFLPNLVPEKNIFLYRASPGLTAIVFFTLVWSLKVYADRLSAKTGRSVLTVLFFLLSLWGITQAFGTVKEHRVLPSYQELHFVNHAMTRGDINDYQRIYFIEPLAEHLRSRGDEYGNLTTRYSHNLIGLVSAILRGWAKGKMEMYHIGYDPQEKKASYVFRDLTHPAGFLVYEIRIDSGPAISLEQANALWRTLVIDMRTLHSF